MANPFAGLRLAWRRSPRGLRSFPRQARRQKTPCRGTRAVLALK